jgi:sulfate permease, SulP family
VPALLISVVGFVESVSVGQTLAAKRRQRIEPDQELVALGASNLSAAFSGGFPVTGGFSRSVVNFDAGAQTPAAGVYTALGILLATLLLTPALYFLPQATLAATIIVAVLSLVDLGILRRTWAYSKPDFAAVAATLLATLGLGVETGWWWAWRCRWRCTCFAPAGRTSPPWAWCRAPSTSATCCATRARAPGLLGLRVDGSLYFANARSAGRPHQRRGGAAARAAPRGAAVLGHQRHRRQRAGKPGSHRAPAARRRVQLHLSEVKGPVMDRLKSTDLLRHLRGSVYLTHFQAVSDLTRQRRGPRC